MNTLIVIALLFSASTCSRILGIFPHTGKSHFDAFSALFIELARKGHNVTIVSHFPLIHPIPNYHDVSLETQQAHKEVLPIGMMGAGPFGKWKHMLELAYYVKDVCQNTFESKNLQEFIRAKEEYDIVITEFFVPNCVLGLMRYTKGSLIAISSSPPLPWVYDFCGNPDQPAFVPSMFSGYSDKMTFVQRVQNVVYYLYIRAVYWLLMDRPGNADAKKYINEDLPEWNHFAYNVSLVLINIHHSLHRPRPNNPGVIEVGGMHVGKPKPLAQNLEKWINESTHGVIYFSMGSMIKGHTFPEDKLAMFQRAFAKLKQRVLWKWETDTMPNKPNNVMIQKWMPQFDILCHPNVKAFITHGGLLGTTEAVHCGVPAIVMPQFGDQYTNAKALEASGGGVILDFSAMLQEDVDNALRTVLDPSFNKQAKELSARFKDRPMPPLETAVYWVEYVARHKGAPHLRSAAVGMPWYQYLLLDVIAFLAAVLFTILYVVYWILTFLIRLLFGKKGKPKQKKQ